MTAKQTDFVRLRPEEMKELRGRIKIGEEHIKELNEILTTRKIADKDKFIEQARDKIFEVTARRKETLRENLK